MSSPGFDRDFDPAATRNPDRVASVGHASAAGGYGEHSTAGERRQSTPYHPDRSPRTSPTPVPIPAAGTHHQQHQQPPRLHLSSSAPTSTSPSHLLPTVHAQWANLPAAHTQQSAAASSSIHSHFSNTPHAFMSPSSAAAPFRATLTNDDDEDYDIDANDDEDLGNHGYDPDAMADDEDDERPSAGGNSSDELMAMDSEDLDDDPMDDDENDDDGDDGLEGMYDGPAPDRSRLSLAGGLEANRSRNPSDVELVVISDDDETFARLDQTQVDQVLDKLREGAEEGDEGDFDDDILFVGETFDTRDKRNKVDLMPWDFQDDRLPQALPPPSEFGALPSTDDLGRQSPIGPARTRNRRGSRAACPSAPQKPRHDPHRARSVSPMATQRARSRDRSVARDDGAYLVGRGRAGQGQARAPTLPWNAEVVHHPNKYELAMLGDFIKVLFMLPCLDEKQKGQQIPLAPGPLGSVLHNIQQLIRSRVTPDEEQITSFHMYLSTLGLDPVIPIRSRLPISKFNLELLPLLPRTLTRPIPLLIPTYLQTTQMVATFSVHPHLYLINAFHRAGRPPPANVPIPNDILPRYLSVDMPPNYNHRLYKLPGGTHSSIAFDSHDIQAVAADFDMLRAINEGREPVTVPAGSLWVPPSNYAASSAATRAKRGDERFDTVVAMVAMALGIYGRDYDVPFVIVVSPFNHDLRNLRYAMHARNILTVCVETVEEFVCVDRWLRLWCRVAGEQAEKAAGDGEMMGEG